MKLSLSFKGGCVCVSWAACPRWERSLIRVMACHPRLSRAAWGSSLHFASLGLFLRLWSITGPALLRLWEPVRGTCDFFQLCFLLELAIWMDQCEPTLLAAMRSFKCIPQNKKIKGKRKKRTPLSWLHSCIESCHGHEVSLVLCSKLFLIFLLRFKIAPWKNRLVDWV